MSFSALLGEIKTTLTKISAELGLSDLNFALEPAREGFGDVTCNIAFLASKQLKKKPYDIATAVAEKYAPFLGNLVARVEAHQSGYLNFYADDAKLCRTIIVATQNDNYGQINLGRGAHLIVEHTSVNPNKALHIGHARNVIVGDCVARILARANYDVSILNYVDDSGLQVADILVGFRHIGFSETPPEGQKFDQYCGDVVYVKTTEKYTTDKKLEQIRGKILQELEDGGSDTAKFAQEITGRVLADQLKTCWRLGASYDCLNFESEIVRSGLWPLMFEKLKTMNLIKYENEGKNRGCWVIISEGEEDKILVRSNGTATYIAKDIPYAAWKLGLVDDPFYYTKYANQNGRVLWRTGLEKNDKPRHNFAADTVITVIDSRQARLQRIIANLVSKLDAGKKTYIHLSYESVTLSAETAGVMGLDTKKSVQMSGRKGLYVNADSVLDMLVEKTKEETKKRNPDISDELLNLVANNVAVATLRYEMIKQDLDKIITFDSTKSLSLEGDTASYLQYAYARATRILEKSGRQPNFDAHYELETQYETNLVKAIGKFELAVQDAANNLSPKVIAKYCYSLAVTFSAFYEHVRVLEAQDDQLNTRLCLVHAFRSCLQKALEMIGIDTPARM